jgi:hypothetical protein
LTFTSTSGDWTNTGGGYITYTGTPAAFEASVRVRVSGSTAQFLPYFAFFINGRWINQIIFGGSATSGAIDNDYCIGIATRDGSLGTANVASTLLFPGDEIALYIRNGNGLAGTASNLQITLSIISK